MRDAGRPHGEAAEESYAASRGRGIGDPSSAEQLHAGPVTFGGRLARPGRDAIKSCLTVYPPEKEYQHLCNIYLDSIHPILPIIKHVDVISTLSSTKLSSRQVVFKQGITLAATLEPSASGYLRLEANGPLLSPQDFHQRLSQAMFSSLDANVLTDRVDHIRILLLMFFYYQPRHASERDFSPLIFSQAVHYSQSLGLHLCEYGKDSGNADAECLFCILWVLDRINASFHGRPCLLHHRDTDRELDECIAKQEQPAFRLFLRVAKMLDRVICLYRPRNDGVEKVEMPIFESMIIETGAEKLPSRLLCKSYNAFWAEFPVCRLTTQQQPRWRSSTTPSLSFPAASLLPPSPHQPRKRQKATSPTPTSTPAVHSPRTGSSTLWPPRSRSRLHQTEYASCPLSPTPWRCPCPWPTKRCATREYPCTDCAPGIDSRRS